MKITILCTDKTHPIIKYLKEWISDNKLNHEIDLIYDKLKLSHGNILFLISCHEIISSSDRQKYDKTLLIHASDLPKGRGWSPYIWDIINGAKTITVSLLKAEDKLDTGEIYKKITFNVEDHELWNEINIKLFRTEIQLMNYSVINYNTLKGKAQEERTEYTYYNKRTPIDSEIDPNQTIIEQFNKIRILDTNRYPPFFKLNGFKYKLSITKIDE